MLPRLHGAFAIAFLFRDHPDLVIGARMGAPLTVGYGEGENYLGSDALALAPLTQRIAYLDEGDWVVVERDAVADLRPRQPAGRARDRHLGRVVGADRQGQSRATSCARKFSSSRSSSRRRCKAMSARSRARSRCPMLGFDLASIKRVTIVACGTSYYAGMVAKYWFEQFARVPVDIDVATRVPLPRAGARAGRAGAVHFASRARPPTRSPRCAMRASEGQMIAVVVNVPTSSMAREADLLLPTHAGPEIGVASTKAFTCQLAVLAALAANLARAKGRLTRDEEREIVAPSAGSARGAQRRARP